MSILVSGFEPFAGRPTNATQEVIRRLIESPPFANLKCVTLPVEFGRSWIELKKEIDHFRPRVVLALGEAEGRNRISVERVALNWSHARIPDNAGHQPFDSEIVPGAETALVTGFDSLSLSKRLNECGFPAQVSLSAGAYVCNHLMYHLLFDLKNHPGVRGGFVHLPLVGTPQPELAGGQWTESHLVSAICLLIEELIQ